jgi:hypothetical protein
LYIKLCIFLDGTLGIAIQLICQQGEDLTIILASMVQAVTISREPTVKLIGLLFMFDCSSNIFFLF